MKMSARGLAWMATVAMLCASAVVFAARDDGKAPGQKRGFHAPTTPAEKKLDEILRRSDADDNLLDFVLKRPWYDPKKDTGYAAWFTAALLNALAKLEADTLKEDCGGKYVEGELCGVDYNPLTCAQDYPNRYLYRAEQEAGNVSLISKAWPEEAKRDATYRMVYASGRWTLDGLRCAEGPTLNMQ